MARTALLATGLNGLVGSKLKQVFAESYDFDTLDISHPEHPVDITNYDQVLEMFARSQANAVVHLAAYTDVTGAWEQRDDTTGLAYRVNVLGTANVTKAAKETHKHLIHISTAYVFDGEKTEPYVETDPVHAIEWYGQTKAEAEQIVQQSGIDWTILRIDQPFRSDPFAKKDIAHRIIEGLKAGTLYPQFTDHFFGPTFIDDFVKIIDWVIRTKTTGLFHASNGEQWSDFEFAQLIQRTHQLPGKVKPGNLAEYLKTLNRPYQRNTALNSQKLLSQLDFPVHSIEAAIKQVVIE